MYFNSIPFLFFLPTVLLIYWGVKSNIRLQNVVLLISSYLFYSWFNWKLTLLIFSISFISFAAGLMIARGNKWVHYTSISLVLLVLGVFKYYNFFISNINSIFMSFGFSLDIPTLYIILPIGISFYSFQAISYIIDVKRKTITPTDDLLSFLTYMSFFPQLVAGPIERARDFLPQIFRQRKLDVSLFADGCRQVLWGFFKKLVVADNCAIVVNDIWNNYSSYNGTTLLVGSILFTFQIYSDFSGYSDIAIGTAKMFGFHLSANFRYPYLAESISDFWRRWHITLLSWFRDYVYIPLGGNRCSLAKVIRNIFVVFGLSGLWHGASWTFVIWGIYHAILYIPLIIKKKVGFNLRAPRIFKIVLVFVLVDLGWIFFRAPTISDAYGYLCSIDNYGPLQLGKISLLYCLILYVIEAFHCGKDYPLNLSRSGLLVKYPALRWCIYYVLTMSIVFLRGDVQTFIYFQF